MARVRAFHRSSPATRAAASIAATVRWSHTPPAARRAVALTLVHARHEARHRRARAVCMLVTAISEALAYQRGPAGSIYRQLVVPPAPRG